MTMRRLQRGNAESVALLFLYALGFGLLTAFVASVALPAWLMRGKARVAVLAVVFGGWASSYWVYVQRPADIAKAETSWHAGARDQCRAELVKVPERLVVDSFVDEGAGLDQEGLLALLSERHLRFLEIKVTEREGLPAITRASAHGGPWSFDRALGSIVRLELGRQESPECLIVVPDYIARAIRRPPFRPDTCVKASYRDTPESAHALRLDPGADRSASEYGSWAFVDLKANAILAKLTTKDAPGEVSRGGPGTGPRLGDASRPTADCRAPHAVIADRIHGPDPDRITHGQMVAQRVVQPQVPPNSIDQQSSTRPAVHPAEERVARSDSEARYLFNPEIDFEPWDGAFANPSRQRLATYGPWLVDREASQMSRLEVTSGVKAFAADGGFFVVGSGSGWRRRPRNDLYRYAADGRLLWVVQVATPPPTAGYPCDPWPDAITVTKETLILSFKCIKLSYDEARANGGKDNQGLDWTISLRDLPAF